MEEAIEKTKIATDESTAADQSSEKTEESQKAIIGDDQVIMDKVLVEKMQQHIEKSKKRKKEIEKQNQKI